MRKSLEVGAVLLLLGGCTDPPPDTQRWSGLPAIELEEIASVGGIEATGHEAIGLVRSVALHPDGDWFAVLDAMTQGIGLFGSNGTFIRTLGGEGEGPGRSRAIRTIEATPDGALCAWDILLMRVTRYDLEGESLETAHVTLPDAMSVRPNLVGFFTDCSGVFSDLQQVAGRKEWNGKEYLPEMTQDTTRFVYWNFDSGSTRILKTMANPPRWWWRGRNANRGFDLIFGVHLASSLSSSGDLWVGTTDSLHWETVDTTGRHSGSISLLTQGRTASQSAVEQERDRRMTDNPLLERIGGDARRVTEEHTREATERVPAREELPSFDRLLSGSDGTMWIREYPEPTAEDARWILIGTSGRAEAQLSLPTGVEVVAANADWVLYLTQDDLDVQLIHVARVRRSTRDPSVAEPPGPGPVS